MPRPARVQGQAKNRVKGPRQLTPAEQHRAWLELVDAEGPFLAVAPLKKVWPAGMPSLDGGRRAICMDARKVFEQAWEALDRNPDSEDALEVYRQARDQWVQTVLRDVVGWQECLAWGQVPGISANSPNRDITIFAQAALLGSDGIGALVYVIDPVESLRAVPSDRWAATPVDRMEDMLRSSGVQIGIVTDGRWWALVCARPNSMAASGVVDALTWSEEPRTRDAFCTIVGRQYLIGGDPAERLPELFEQSVAAAEEITEALGAQVRSAVELLVQSFDESAADARRRGLPSPLPSGGPTDDHVVYEAAVTVMMRIVFLLFAEERNLLPSGELFEQGYGIAGVLDALTARVTDESEEALDSTSLTWHRLLATTNALYWGASFENLRMPAYGGSLFDPCRFGFLTAVDDAGVLALTVSDRVMLHMLRAVQVAHIGGEARRIAFRDVDVEQIGYIYEGLLGFTVSTASQVIVGLKGKAGAEPEIPLTELEACADAYGGVGQADPRKIATAVREWVKGKQPSAVPQTANQIARGMGTEVDSTFVSALHQVVREDQELRDRIIPWLGIIRPDLRERPFVVTAGGLLVTETPSRKNAGAHYTPKSLAEEVVLHALQPLCYRPGPHQSDDPSQWRLKASDDLLRLKVADIACGSGAFLVAAARYLTERVVEALIAENPANAEVKDLYTRAMRQVVAKCLYGADINEMAVEMCKLSLWLVSLDRDKPFSFVDDKVLCGNSLLGVTDIRQLESLHIDPSKVKTIKALGGSAYAEGTLFGEGSEADSFLDIRGIIRTAVEIRRDLAQPVVEDDPMRNTAWMNRQWSRYQDTIHDLTVIADGVIAAGLQLGGKPGRSLNEAYDKLRVAVDTAFSGTMADPVDTRPEAEMLRSIITHGLTPSVTTDYTLWQPLHWALEVPDVMEQGGFDAIIGNPPFLGGSSLSGSMGGEVRTWFVNVLAQGRSGKADLVVYFFLRAMSLLKPAATLGLVATNTVGQNESKVVGLDAMVADGFTITRSIRSQSWSAPGANLEVAVVWGTRAQVSESVKPVSDGTPVRRISTLLEPAGRVEGRPFQLAENKGIVFEGCKVYGEGFVITEELAQEWIAADPRNAEVLFPYLGGKDLNSRPDSSPSRWCIDFREMPE